MTIFLIMRLLFNPSVEGTKSSRVVCKAEPFQAILQNLSVTRCRGFREAIIKNLHSEPKFPFVKPYIIKTPHPPTFAVSVENASFLMASSSATDPSLVFKDSSGNLGNKMYTYVLLYLIREPANISEKKGRNCQDI